MAAYKGVSVGLPPPAALGPCGLRARVSILLRSISRPHRSFFLTFLTPFPCRVPDGPPICTVLVLSSPPRARCKSVPRIAPKQIWACRPSTQVIFSHFLRWIFLKWKAKPQFRVHLPACTPWPGSACDFRVISGALNLGTSSVSQESGLARPEFVVVSEEIPEHAIAISPTSQRRQHDTVPYWDEGERRGASVHCRPLCRQRRRLCEIPTFHNIPRFSIYGSMAAWWPRYLQLFCVCLFQDCRLVPRGNLLLSYVLFRGTSISARRFSG
jgi:hypothetical protein